VIVMKKNVRTEADARLSDRISTIFFSNY